MQITIYGLPEIIGKIQRAIAALRPGGEVGTTLAEDAKDMRDYAASVTHEQTGALASAHRYEVTGLMARVYLDGGVANPRTGQSVGTYGPIEAARGGDHDFYALTQKQFAGKLGVRLGKTLQEIFG